MSALLTTRLLSPVAAGSAAPSLRARVVHGAAWAVIGAVAPNAVGLLVSMVTARILGREGLGALGVVQSTVGMFGVISGIGLGLTATKYVAELRIADPPRAGRILALTLSIAWISSLVVAAILYAAAPRLAASALNAAGLAAQLRIATLLLLFNAVSGAQAGALGGFEAFRPIAKVALVRSIVSMPITVVLARYFGLTGAVIGLVVAAAIGMVMNQVAIRHECVKHGLRLRYGSGWNEIDILLRFSFPAFLSGCMVMPTAWLANTFLLARQQGYAEMGLFTAANQWRLAVAYLPALLAQPFLSILCNLRGADTRAYNRLLWGNIALVGVTTAVFSAAAALAAPYILRLYGPHYSDAAGLFRILMLVAVVESLARAVGQDIISRGRMWTSVGMNGLWALVLVVCARPLVHSHAAMGLAVATLIAYGVHGLTTLLYAIFFIQPRRALHPLSSPVWPRLGNARHAFTGHRGTGE